MASHQYIHQTFFRLLILFLYTIGSIFFLSLSSVHAQTTKTYENEGFHMSSAGGDFQEPTHFVLSPQAEKTVYWSYIKENPSNLYSTTEATRIYVPQSRNIYVFSENSPIEKFTFKIHHETENRFFRIHSIDINPSAGFLPTITVENASPLPFSFTMQDWKISGEGFEIPLPNEALDPGEKRTFILDLPDGIEPDHVSEILLISPSVRVRDRVKIPALTTEEFLIRQSLSPLQQKRIARPEFIIERK